MPRGAANAKLAEDYQEATAPRREQSRPPEHVFRESLKKHAAQKAVYFDGNSAQRTEVRRVGLSRLQFGNTEYVDVPGYPAPNSPGAVSLLQMEVPVPLTRTMSRTAGMGAFSKRRSTNTPGNLHGNEATDDSESQSDSDSSDSPYDANFWEAGVGVFLPTEGAQLSSPSLAASPGLAGGAPRRRSSLALGPEDAPPGFAPGARPYLTSPLSRPSGGQSISGVRDAPGGVALLSDPDASAADGEPDSSAAGDSGYQDRSEAASQDRRAGRVDQLLESLRKNDPKSDASLFMGTKLRRNSRRDSFTASGQDSSNVRRARSVTAAHVYQLDQQALQGDHSLSGEAPARGPAGGPQSPLPMTRSAATGQQSPVIGSGQQGRFRRVSTQCEMGKLGYELDVAGAAGMSSLAARTQQRAGTSQVAAVASGLPSTPSALLATSPSASSPLAAMADSDYQAQYLHQHQHPQQGSASSPYMASPTTSSKLLRVVQEGPLAGRGPTHITVAGSLSPRTSAHGQAHSPQLSPTPHAASMPGNLASPSQRSLDLATRAAAVGAGAARISDSASSRRLSVGPYSPMSIVSPLSRAPASSHSQQELRHQLQQAAGAAAGHAAAGLSLSADYSSGGTGEGRVGLGAPLNTASVDGPQLRSGGSGRGHGVAMGEPVPLRLPSLLSPVGSGSGRARG